MDSIYNNSYRMGATCCQEYYRLIEITIAAANDTENSLNLNYNFVCNLKVV